MNPMDMMKNLQDMQGKMQDMQSKLSNITVEGVSGGGVVKVVLTGQYSVQDVKIDKTAIDPEDPEFLEDLVLSAFTDASNKVKVKLQQEAASIAGGLNLPPEMMGL
ncbi:MAG: YbaB/EbfC family nucleoid-associated protein [Spirochaetales bacterium]|nr:YbaB/EbfC family nucleoid-associated protein [Spirochaetales bacterium]